MTLRLALVALALASLTGCPDSTPADAGQDALAIFDHEVGIRDTGSPDAVVVIHDDVMNIDAAVDAFAVDAFAGDAFAPGDAFTPGDAATTTADAPTRDARGAAPGMCTPRRARPHASDPSAA